MVYFLESDYAHDQWHPLDEEDARQFIIRREILRALAGHTCLDIYHRKFNTLSFLLFFVDELQQWGRPTWEEEQYGADDGDHWSIHVKFFNERNVYVEIVDTRGEKWEDKQRESLASAVNRPYRTLRLGVGTPAFWAPRPKSLTYKIRNERGQYESVELRGGKLHRLHDETKQRQRRRPKRK